jgi:phage tail-like protein
MPVFQVNSERLDPYKNFEFQIKWQGQYVAGFSECSMLELTTEVITHRDGGDPSTSHKSPGRIEYEAITLERGVTHDTAFANWASKVWSREPDREELAPPEELRDDIILEIFNETGQKAITYLIHRCWSSEYRAFPDTGDDANSIAIQHIKLECEGWERDQPVTEPACPP